MLEDSLYPCGSSFKSIGQASAAFCMASTNHGKLKHFMVLPLIEISNLVRFPGEPCCAVMPPLKTTKVSTSYDSSWVSLRLDYGQGCYFIYVTGIDQTRWLLGLYWSRSLGISALLLVGFLLLPSMASWREDYLDGNGTVISPGVGHHTDTA